MTFRPLPWMTLFTGLALAVLVYLGLWQVDRMAWKAGLLDQLSAQMDAPPADLNTKPLTSKDNYCETSRFRPVQLNGKLTGPPVFVYGVREGKPSHHVFRALQLPDGSALAIDLGYVPYDQHELIPSEFVSAADMAITGIIRCPQKPGQFTPEPDPKEKLWYVTDLPDFAPAMIAGTSLTVPTAYYIQRVAKPGEVTAWPRTRNPREMFAEIPNNHLGYALTWFGLAAALIVIYIVFHVSHGRLRFGK